MADLIDPKSYIARTADEAERKNVPLDIVAITRRATRLGRNEPNLLIMADHPLADGVGRRCFANFHSFTARRRSEFPITNTELSVMAALARIGLSRRPTVDSMRG